MIKKIRLDVLMVEKGLAESRSLAQRMIMAGQVRVDGQMGLKPSAMLSGSPAVELDQGPKYVSRGGDKLEPALAAFGLEDLSGWVCADVGSSTGGFTDCLLQRGAERVYAIDVGYGVLHWKLRNDTRVISMERTNARSVTVLPEPVRLVTIDASFISLKILLPVVSGWFGPQGGRVVALIKPQFEAGRKESAKGEGVIRDPEVHRKVLLDVLNAAVELHFSTAGLIQSPLHGPKGNIEFLVDLRWPAGDQIEDVSQAVADALGIDIPSDEQP